MDSTEINRFFKEIESDVEKWARKNRNGLILGGIIGFSLMAAYLLDRGRKKKTARPPKSLEPALDMERYVFEIPTDHGNKEAIVESSGECYGVTLDGKYIGSMWRDEARGLQWTTEDKGLTPHIWDIAKKLAWAFSREGFPALLKGTYPEIESTVWKSSETLEVVVSAETDIEVFTAFLKDEVLNLVDFEEHLDLIVKKADNAYFVIVTVN
jgi:hypothetical protein